jgi:hypothetical protein
VDEARPVRNPFIDAIGPYCSFQEWLPLLENDPLADFPAGASEEVQDEYLGYADERFTVTKASLNIAMEIQTMLRAGYRQRNPYEASNRKLFYQLLERGPKLDAHGLPACFYPRAYCYIVRGITNLGKSTAVNRALDQYDQVIIHGDSRDARWLRHTQVVYLIVKMPGDGTRKGLLLNILAALDQTLFTDYVNEHSRGRPEIEKLAIKVQKLLALHSVGVLVIEEMQDKNFMKSRDASNLQLFFLGILSFGVPIVLVGNPMAFANVGEFKQTESRFTSVDPITLWPYHDWEEPEWRDAIAPAIWNYRVVADAAPFDENVAKTLWKCSGGIPGYARKLVCDVQKNIIRGSSQRLDVSSIERQFEQSESFAEYRPLIKALCSFDNAQLVAAKGDDIPVDDFVRRWKALGLDNTEELDGESGRSESESDAIGDIEQGNYSDKKKRDMGRIKSAKTRKRRKQKRNKKTEETVGPEDLRHTDTVTKRLAKGLEQLESDLSRDRETTKKKRSKK